MGNVLEKSKREQVISLGRLGWSLRRIEEATGVRRETAGGYLRLAGIALRRPGGWGHGSPAKPAIEVTTGFLGCKPALNSKPAIEVTTGFLLAKTASEPTDKRSGSGSEAYRELIELELSHGRNDGRLTGSGRRARAAIRPSSASCASCADRSGRKLV